MTSCTGNILITYKTERIINCPCACHEGICRLEAWRYSCIPLAQLHAPTSFPWQKQPQLPTECSLHGPERPSGCCEEDTISCFCRQLNRHSSVIQPLVQSLYRLCYGRPTLFRLQDAFRNTKVCGPHELALRPSADPENKREIKL